MVFLCINGDWHANITKTSTTALFCSKTGLHQQDTVNEGHERFGNKYILNSMKTVIWGFHQVIVVEPDVLGVAHCSQVISSQQYKNTRRLCIQGYEWMQKIKMVYSFKTSGSSNPTTWCNNSEHVLSQYENRFATNKILQHCVASSG